MPKKESIKPELVEIIWHRWGQNLPIRRTLPERGRLHIDRQLPFLCLYRKPLEGNDEGTERLVMSEAAYMVAPSSPPHQKAVKKLIRGLAQRSVEAFGSFLVIEIFSGPVDGKASDPAVPSVPPAFRIHPSSGAALSRTVERIFQKLEGIKILKQSVTVEVVERNSLVASRLPLLFSLGEMKRLHTSFIAISVPPVYQNKRTGQVYPLILRALRHDLSLALKHAYFDFSSTQTTHQPLHYHGLGRHAVVKAVWDIDRQLVAVDNQFDFLLQLNPVNSQSSWENFKESRFRRLPEFHYRPANFDPVLLKRQLFQIPIERVEDPALQNIFYEKQEEMDRKISMLSARDTPRFLYGSLQQYGPVSDDLVQLAGNLLSRLPPPQRSSSLAKNSSIDARSLAGQAMEELTFYRQQLPGINARVVVTSRISGIMVSKGKLLINNNLKTSKARLQALIQHEVGTHLLTYYNGREQPFKLLFGGLAGYEGFQEGLAVLSEYLVDGLTLHRVRQLAARVMAVRDLVDGASFLEVFRRLRRKFGISKRSAFGITLRTFRGGGFTKDAIYLDGFRQVLHYLENKGEFDTLLLGKISAEHIPVMKELRFRNILQPPALRPRYLSNSNSVKRLKELRHRTLSVEDWIISAIAPEHNKGIIK